LEGERRMWEKGSDGLEGGMEVEERYVGMFQGKVLGKARRRPGECCHRIVLG
jgi:hypothetical protein